MKHEYFTKADRVILRPLESEDLEKMRLLRNQNRSRFIDTMEITAETQSRWYACYLYRAGDYMFSVFHEESDKWIGAVGLYDVNMECGVGEFGRLLIGRELVPERGMGVDATKAVCDFAFRQLRLKKLGLEVFHDNIAALITYLKAGFMPIRIKECADGRKLLYMECDIK